MKRKHIQLLAVIGSVALFAVATPLVYSAMLDRHDTRRSARRVEEKECALRDRIDDWAEASRPERFPLKSELDKKLDRFETALEHYREELRTHDQPWDIRDETGVLIRETRLLGDGIHEAHFLPPSADKDYVEVRVEVNDLAKHFELPAVGANAR